MIINKSSYKYEGPFKKMHEIIETWNDGTVTLQMGATADILNIQQIRLYKYEEYA